MLMLIPQTCSYFYANVNIEERFGRTPDEDLALMAALLGFKTSCRALKRQNFVTKGSLIHNVMILKD